MRSMELDSLGTSTIVKVYLDYSVVAAATAAAASATPDACQPSLQSGSIKLVFVE